MDGMIDWVSPDYYPSVGVFKQFPYSIIEDDMIIATRNLVLKNSGADSEIQIRIMNPEFNQDQWICRYEIQWPNAQRSSFAAGVDSVQALHLALQKIGLDLYMSDGHASGNLVWMEAGKGYGFPVPKNGRDFLIGFDKEFEG
ncbi:DUF6968 family protein [Methylobacterium trifolii]|uniref:DUF6968 family protein n=1 Tax=Methylobacterium trifolii TaxID=1003092 RepID=UPI001EDEDBCE|nr:hypothetical protein [Methylobacterium trifolii]